MATSIYFGGRRINVPGAYSVIDASELTTTGISATGIVALIGTAEGGKPLSVDPTFSDSTNADALDRKYRSGDLLVAGKFAFEPALDDAIQGANRVVGVKVNPATQSTATLADSNSVDSVVVTSLDYGLFTAQINIDVDTGTTQGSKITILFEDDIETFDDVGGDPVFDVVFAPGASGYTTMTGSVTSTQFVAAATKVNVGLDGQITANNSSAIAVEIVSSSAADITQTVTVYGTTALNAPVSETVTLTGLTAVTTTALFRRITGVSKSAATVGTVTVVDPAGPTTLVSLAPATLTRGLLAITNGTAAGVLTLVLDAASVGAQVVVRGTNTAGAAISERFDLAAGTAVVGTTAFADITQIELGDLAAARTLTLSVNAAVTAHSTYNTVQKVVDRLNALTGFTANATVSNALSYLMASLDYLPAVSILTTANFFYGDLQAFLTVLNDNSQFVSAARAVGGVSAPANTASAVFLTGGIEGAVTITEWQDAFKLLKRRRVNTIVTLTQDPAVHALLLAHLKERAGRLRSEANGYVGIGTVGGEGETRTAIKSQIRALQSRHLSFISQELQRFDPLTGVATWYPPYMFAAVAAGMQAGSGIGEPLTYKKPNVLDIRNDSSWTVEDDVEELIDAGLMMAQNVDAIGVRWVRSITGYLADDNVVFGEMSANESMDIAIYELRRRLDLAIGKPGFAGQAGTIKSLALAILGTLVDDQIIAAYKPPQVEQIGDVFPVSVDIAPVVPTNFIPITVHLTVLRQTA